MVFCDVSKAFDRVWHKGLTLKLQMYGIKGNMLRWLSRYISDRSQRVFVNGVMSKPEFLKAGVPQGSVLNPFLFIVYINDIADRLDSLLHNKTLCRRPLTWLFSTDYQLLEYTLNANLSTLSNWAKRWLIQYNPDKTKAVLFSTRDETKNIDLYFDGTKIQIVQNHKHLGISFTSMVTLLP